MMIGVAQVMPMKPTLRSFFVTAQVFQRGQTTRRSSINLSG